MKTEFVVYSIYGIYVDEEYIDALKEETRFDEEFEAIKYIFDQKSSTEFTILKVYKSK